MRTSNVISVLLYSLYIKTWKMTKGDEQMLDAFSHIVFEKNLKGLLATKSPEWESKGKSWNGEISTTIRRRRWRWIGHVLRMDKIKHVRAALTWTAEGKRKRGRPKETWRRTVERERELKELCRCNSCKSCSKGKDRMERSCSWSYSSQEEKEISQVSIPTDSHLDMSQCYCLEECCMQTGDTLSWSLSERFLNFGIRNRSNRVFSSPEPKARVSYCHSAPSVVRL